jgi:tetratricopeptide (TPR) repeat protein
LSFFSKFLPRKGASFYQTSEIEAIRNLMHQGKFELALNALDELYTKVNDEEQLLLGTIKCDILIQMGNMEEARSKAENILNEGKDRNNPLIIAEAIIPLTNSLLNTAELKDIQELIKEGENQLKHIEKQYKEEYTRVKSTYHFIEGKLCRKQGDLDRALHLLQMCIDERTQSNELYEKAEPLNVLGIIYAIKTEFDTALNYLNQSLEIFNELGNISTIVKIQNNMGLIYYQKGERDLALQYYTESLENAEKINNKLYIATLSLNIGLIYFSRGGLNTALEYFLKSKEISMQTNNLIHLGYTLTNIGRVYEYKGELEAALDLYSQSLKIATDLDIKEEIGTLHNNLANTYLKQGDPGLALEYFKKSLGIFEELGNKISISESLYNNILQFIDFDLMEEVEEYLQKLQEINTAEDNKIINQFFILAKANVLKSKDRIISKMEAQQLFKEIADEEMVKHEYTISAMLNYSELLLLELKTSGSDEVLREIKAIFDSLLQLAEMTDRLPISIEIYILQGRLSLLELDVAHTDELLEKAFKLAEDKKIPSLVEKVQEEKDNLKDEMIRIKELVDTSSSVYDRIQETKIKEYILKAQQIVNTPG